MSVWRIVSEPARMERLEQLERLEREVGRGETRDQSEPTFGGPAPSAPPLPLPSPPARTSGTTDGARLFDSFVDKITKWIPGDVLALYVAGVTVVGQATGQPSFVFLVVMVVVTILVGALTAFATGIPIDKTTGTRIALAVAAFLIWTLTVPSSGWQTLGFVRDNPGLVAVGAGIFGLLFGLAAEGVDRRLKSP